MLLELIFSGRLDAIVTIESCVVIEKYCGCVGLDWSIMRSDESQGVTLASVTNLQSDGASDDHLYTVIRQRWYVDDGAGRRLSSSVDLAASRAVHFALAIRGSRVVNIPCNPMGRWLLQVVSGPTAATWAARRT